MEKAVVIAVCLVACVTDLRWRRIPNWLNGLGLLFVLVGRVSSAGLLGAVAGVSWLLLALPLVVLSLLRPDGFGMGDAKLIGVVFAALGTYGLLALLIACAAGSLWGWLSGGLRASVSIPLAPFITAGAIAASFPW
ncbi:unannotated protein [freshwater metagenome]|uniref:Unannotated protein n=1 Tax=freshwater metagenome TaxID=449393 RepID=A0A6J7CJ14_9ZZZZ